MFCKVKVNSQLMGINRLTEQWVTPHTFSKWNSLSEFLETWWIILFCSENREKRRKPSFLKWLPNSSRFPVSGLKSGAYIKVVLQSFWSGAFTGGEALVVLKGVFVDHKLLNTSPWVRQLSSDRTEFIKSNSEEKTKH